MAGSRAPEYTVTPLFRQIVREKYPLIDSRLGYWALFGRLFFFKNHEGGIPIPRELLAKMEDLSSKIESRHYDGSDFLEAFSQDIFPLDYGKEELELIGEPGSERLLSREWVYSGGGVVGHCRRVYSSGIDPYTEKALMQELRGSFKFDDSVYLVSGEPRNAKVALQLRQIDRLDAIQALDRAQNPDTRRVIEYMNSVPSNIYTRLLSANLPRVQRAIGELEDEDVELHQRSLLSQLIAQPQGYHRVGKNGKAPRAFQFGAGFSMTEGTIRQALTHGCYECDLRNAQLAIVANLWAIPKVTEFLLRRVSFWSEVGSYLKLELPLEKSTKGLMKDATYAIIFGADTRPNGTVSKLLQPAKFDIQQFMGHPIIQDLIEASQREIQRIKTNGGGYDCYDQWIPYDSRAEHGAIDAKVFQARSILAQQAQAVELKIVSEVIKLAETSHSFKVVCWQHDGFTVRMENQSRADLWLGRISSVINNKAQELGVITDLEIKALLDPMED